MLRPKYCLQQLIILPSSDLLVRYNLRRCPKFRKTLGQVLHSFGLACGISCNKSNTFHPRAQVLIPSREQGPYRLNHLNVGAEIQRGMIPTGALFGTCVNVLSPIITLQLMLNTGHFSWEKADLS